MRRWVMIIVALCFLLPAIGLLLAVRIHPSTVANITLATRRVPFLTDTVHLLSPNDNEQLMVTEIASLDLQLSQGSRVESDGQPVTEAALRIKGQPGATCAFYHVRSSAFELSGPTLITLETPGGQQNDSQSGWFTLKSHGMMKATLSSQPAKGGTNPGFLCRRVLTSGKEVEVIQAKLSPTGGDLMSLVTADDTRLDFQLSQHSEIGDGQIPLLGEVRFSDVDAQTGDEKTVLLKPPPGYRNEVTFDNVGRKLVLDDADLISVETGRDFYLRQFTIKDGIQLSMHGVVRDVRTGAGAGDLESRMPSWFDHLDNEKRLWLAIPAIAGVLLGMVEKMGLLNRNEKTA